MSGFIVQADNLEKATIGLAGLLNLYNWPPQPKMGYGITLIYFIALIDGNKLKCTKVRDNVYKIETEAKNGTLSPVATLGPRP